MDHKAVNLVRRIIGHARAAPADEERWRFLVSSVGELFDARGTVMFTPEPAPGQQPFGIAQGDVVEGMGDYFAHWAHQDAWLQAVDRRTFFQRAGETRFTQEFLPEAELTRTAFYNDWARHCHAERSLSLKITDRSDIAAPPLHLSIFRKISDSPFEQNHKEVLLALWPELQAAARAHYALQPLQASPAVAQALEDLPTAAWVLRRDARVVFANACARELGQAGAWAQERAGRLSRLGHLDAAAIVAHIARPETDREVATAVPTEGGLKRGLLHWIPIADSPLHATAWPGAAVMVMLQLPLPASQDAAWHEHLARHYRLTRSQSDVLLGLARGQTVEDIAASRHVSTNTVRSHLRQLMDKTGLHRQAELVRLALGA
jgi:DNA-binding CsgD family transcriptional regulator